MMSTYYLRCIDSNYRTMLEFCETLGAIQTTDGITSATQGGCWDYIGPIVERTGGTDDAPVMTAKKDLEGNTYIHANLRSPINMNEAAAAQPELAECLSSTGSFFIVDATGEPARPNKPHRIFAGD